MSSTNRKLRQQLNSLNIFLEKMMQKALTPQHPSESDCCAGDAVEDAEETDIPLLLVSIGGRLLCICSMPTTLIC